MLCKVRLGHVWELPKTWPIACCFSLLQRQNGSQELPCQLTEVRAPNETKSGALPTTGRRGRRRRRRNGSAWPLAGGAHAGDGCAGDDLHDNAARLGAALRLARLCRGRCRVGCSARGTRKQRRGAAAKSRAVKISSFTARQRRLLRAAECAQAARGKSAARARLPPWQGLVRERVVGAFAGRAATYWPHTATRLS
jgi:hypothetical protein